jgi:hypothetical protein
MSFTIPTPKTSKETAKKTIKMIFRFFIVLKIAIKRDLRPLNALLINFVRLGEVFYFALDFGVF